MKTASKILIVGHNDVTERSLLFYLRKNGYTDVYSTFEMAMNTTIQASVYDFFQEKRPEYVFLGSTRSGGIEANQKYAAEFLYHNSESQNNIVYASWKFGVKKLLYLASSCVYPKECSQPMREEYIGTGKMEETSEAYSIAKLAGIKLCQMYKKQYGLNTIVMIPATVYGPGSDTDLQKAHVLGALIAKFTAAVKENKKEVVLWGSGKPRREFLYADDFVQACLFLMNNYDGYEVINAGSGSDITVKELADIIAKTCGFNGAIKFDTSKPDGAMQKLLDNSRISKLGWQHKVSLKEGILKTIQWYKNLKL